MQQKVAALIDEVIAREGGYVDHPLDRGGPTKFGVTEQTARAFGYKGEMRAMPRDTAVCIYLRRYWTAPMFDRIVTRDEALAAELFDAGVNMGPAKAGAFLQRALNVLNRGASDYPDILADGAIGAMTLAALDGYLAKRPGAEGKAVLLWTVKALRTGRYVEIMEANPSQEAFGYGWIARQVR